MYLEATSAGTYDLSGKTLTGNTFYLDASLTDADVTLIGSDQDNQILIGGAGNDTLAAGAGNNDVLNGGSGYTTYQFGSAFGQDTVNNNGGSSANGEIDFGGGLTDENLSFQVSGNNLVIDELGTNQSVTVAGWENGGGAQVGSINADGYTLVASQVQALVSAMASYAANNSGFNPTTATSMPTDSTLQNAIAAAWQHS
jgi:hypothetical protein